MKALLLCLLLLVVACGRAEAQSCAITSSSLTSTAYDPFGSQIQVQGSVSFSCTRPKGNPRFPATFLVGVSGANVRTMSSGGNTLNFSLFSDYAPCGTPWQGTGYVQVANTAPLPGDNNTLTTPTMTGTFCFQVPASQSTAVPGTYVATPTLTITDSANVIWLNGGVLTLTTPVSASCSIVSSPTPLVINYTAFGAQQTGTSDFQVRCTNSTPYTLSLDATSGTIVGLPYTLSVPSSGTGTGLAQTVTITGTIAAGLAGTCSGATCSATQVRTLTLSY
jgi:spore coat protein U-like protein